MMASYFKQLVICRSVGCLALGLSIAAIQPAWAYKTERVCEMTEQTAKSKPRKVCKTLLVMTDAQKAATGKVEPKKEEKKGGHH